MILADVRAGIATLLDACGVRVYDTIPEAPEAPCAVIALGPGEYDADFDDATTVVWVVLVLTTRVDDARAQRQLDELLDPTTGIRQWFTADATIGATVDTSRVTGWDTPLTFTIGGTDHVGVEVAVETIG